MYLTFWRFTARNLQNNSATKIDALSLTRDSTNSFIFLDNFR